MCAAGIAKHETEDDPDSPGVLMLSDIDGILDRWTGAAISSKDLLQELTSDDEGPLAEWRRGAPSTPRGVAKLLKVFGRRTDGGPSAT